MVLGMVCACSGWWEPLSKSFSTRGYHTGRGVGIVIMGGNWIPWYGEWIWYHTERGAGTMIWLVRWRPWYEGSGYYSMKRGIDIIIWSGELGPWDGENFAQPEWVYRRLKTT